MEAILIVAVVVAIMFVVVLTAVKSLIIICPPNKVAVISGRQVKLGDGSKRGYRVLRGGFTVRIPMIEKVDYMDLNTIPIDVSVSNAYSKGAIPLDVQGVANIKVSSRDGVLANSVERFLGRPPEYIQQIAKENLEANLRGVLSTLTPEEVNEDRLKFAQTLIDEADDDIRTLGLELDVLKIQNVTDQVGYLEAVGRRRTAQVIKEARESEALQSAEAEEAEAQSRKRAELAKVQSNLAIAEETNKLRVRQAELDAEANAREEEAGVAGERAKAAAEQLLEDERIKLQKRRLEANVVAPARAKREALELEAKGNAAHIIEDGNAQIEVFRRMSNEYRSAGAAAQEVMVMQMLPDLVDQIVGTVNNMDIGKVTVIDNSGGAGGGALPGVASQMPAAVIAITEQIEAATGVNILHALSKPSAIDDDEIVDAQAKIAAEASNDAGDGASEPSSSLPPPPPAAN
ncbi:MAG: flotillin family protein [Acidimicrobiales bacterium]|nr:flotillin family protein [Acidimicrobiales bacterium]